MRQLKKYKTVLHHLHKQLNIEGLSKKTLEEQVKRIAGFKQYDPYTIYVLITLVYLTSDAMGCKLKEDNSIRMVMKDSNGIAMITGDNVLLDITINDTFQGGCTYEFRYSTAWALWGITDGGAFASLDELDRNGATLTIVTQD